MLVFVYILLQFGVNCLYFNSVF